MQRIEYKITEVNREWLEDVLKHHGAEKTFEGELTTVYFDQKDEEFMKSGKRLTLRKKADKAVLTFRDKYREAGFGVADEYEVEVSSFGLAEKILLELGFHSFVTFRKHRVDYKAGDVVVSFDRYTGELSYIPEYMMIEADTEQKAFEWAEKLGYNKGDCEAISVLDLIERYKAGQKNKKEVFTY